MNDHRPASTRGGDRSPKPAFGSRPAGLWIIKHLVSPLDRYVVRISGGRVRPPSSLAVPSLLLTVVGRRTGQDRTIPLVYVCDGERYVVGNARPAGERRNPWVLNLRAAGRGRVQLGRRVVTVSARELDEVEVERWWPALTKIWPAFADQYAATGERTMFVLEPVTHAQRVEAANGSEEEGAHEMTDPTRRHNKLYKDRTTR